MKIEVKNVEISKQASQETLCFGATVYIDGKNAGRVWNAGHGGCNEYSPWSLQQTLDRYAQTLDPVVTDLPDIHDATKLFTYQPDADHVIDELVAVWEVTREFKRLSKNHALFVKSGEKGVFRTRKLTADQIRVMHSDPAKIAATLGAEKILNVLPQEEAIEIFRNHA